MRVKYFPFFLILFINIPNIIAQTDSENKNSHQVYNDLDKVQFEIREFVKKQPVSVYINCDNAESIKKGIENRNKKINYLNSPHLISLCQKEHDLMNKINGGADIENASCNRGRKPQIEKFRKEIKDAKECLERIKNKNSNETTTKITSQQNNIQNKQESIYTKRQREAKQARRDKEAQEANTSSAIDSERMAAYNNAIEEAENARKNGDFLASSKALEKAKYYNPSGVSDQQLGYARAASYADETIGLIAMADKSYEAFQHKKNSLTTFNARDINGIYNEFYLKSQELGQLYENRKVEGAQQVDQAVRSMQSTMANNEVESTMIAWVGEISKASGRKQLEKEKQEEINKLNSEKERLINDLAISLKNKAFENKLKFLEAAKYAVDEEVESYYISQVEYQDCIENNSRAFLVNNSYCNSPSNDLDKKEKTDFTAEELFQAYRRKTNSRWDIIKDFSKTYLEMAIALDPNNEKYLKEMAYKHVNSNEAKLKYLGMLVKVSPENTQYLTDLNKAIKIDLGRKGAVGELKNGKRHGMWTLYWANGDIQQIVDYDLGELRKGSLFIVFDENLKETRVKENIAFKRIISYSKENSQYFVQEFTKENFLISEGYYLDLNLKTKQGHFKFYYPSGQLKSEILFKNNRMYDYKTAYNKTGDVIENGDLSQGTGTARIPIDKNNFTEIKLKNGKVEKIKTTGNTQIELHFNHLGKLIKVIRNNIIGEINSLEITHSSTHEQCIAYNEKGGVHGFTLYLNLDKLSPEKKYYENILRPDFSFDPNYIADINFNYYLSDVRDEINSENKFEALKSLANKVSSENNENKKTEKTLMKIYEDNLQKNAPDFDRITIDEFYPDGFIKSYSVHQKPHKKKPNFGYIYRYYFSPDKTLKEQRVFDKKNNKEIKKFYQRYY